ncbi:MAG: membrane protein insertion efficiency factor YidD [Bacteroidia bacterium]|nr:membrane protein insertion efficiency factor YidD [Bacteroidia bacterium]
MRHLRTFLFVFCFIPYGLLAQGMELRKDLIYTTQKPPIEHNHTGLHGFYKKYISSQDGSNCQFYPSCSHYAKLSIKKHGMLLGIFLGADRLLRCNGKTDDYITDTDNKAIDQP